MRRTLLAISTSVAALHVAAQPNDMKCSLADKLPADAIVIAAGAYTGRKSDPRLDPSIKQTTLFDVSVQSTQPVALLLAAYESAVWNLTSTNGTRVVAVFLTGYHRQVVKGLPSNTPILRSTVVEGEPCGYEYFAGDEPLTWINPRSRSVFGRDATRAYIKAPGGVIKIVEPEPPSKGAARSPKEISTQAPRLEFPDLHASLHGSAEFDKAVADGVLRRASPADVQMVKRALQALAADNPSGEADIPPLAGAAPSDGPAVQVPRFWLQRSYVVLKPFVFPAGLYGGHLAHFIVPKGVPAPTGDRGHSMVVDLNLRDPCLGC